MTTVEEWRRLLDEHGARIVGQRGDTLEARWRGVPVRVSIRAGAGSERLDAAALARVFASLSQLPDPVSVAEIDLLRHDDRGRQPVFVPVVSRQEGQALRLLSGDSFLVILDRESGAMTVLGADVSGTALALEHRLPRASLHGEPARSVADVLLHEAPAAAPAPPAKWPRLLPLLRCVRCELRAALQAQHDALVCTACGAAYPIRDGVPILLRDPGAAVEPQPAPISSNSYSRQALAFMDSAARGAEGTRGWVLDCGCGQPVENLPHVVHLEILRYRNVDIVASSDRLPFAEGSFDAAISESVLEHVRDPWTAVAELHRVLKPGGALRVDAPFLAPFHAYPDHYHNFTQTGLERLLSAFERIDGGIGPHQEPWLAIGWILRLARQGLPSDALRQEFDRTSLGELLAAISRGVPPATLHPLSDEVRTALAAGFYFLGRKRQPVSPASSVVSRAG